MPGEKKFESQNKHMVQNFGSSSRNVPRSSQIILSWVLPLVLIFT